MSEKFNQTVMTRDQFKLHVDIQNNGRSSWLIVTHGVAEHSARHHYIEELFGDKYNICWWDLRGHGRSEGERGQLDSFQSYVDDLHLVVDYLRESHGMQQWAFFGHSMGALITSMAAESYGIECLSVFLSGPPVGIPGALGLTLKSLPKALWSTLSRSLPAFNLPLVAKNALSHDPKVGEAFISDELCLQKFSPGVGIEIFLAGQEHFSKAPIMPERLSVAWGTQDTIVDPKAIENYFIEHLEKDQWLCVAGAYHEVHNEIPKFRNPYFEFLQTRLSACLEG